ncbi:MAG: iron-containing alcohol dehydrogenase [Desulfobacula sp.]|nr:iron-containing alcohol dehydrogenase [Desulfobacula sp.]
MIPTHYEFNNPVKIISGSKAVDNLPFELEQLGVSRPLIITDQGVAGAGLLSIVKNACSDSNISIGAVYDQTPPDSSLSTVKQIAGLYRKTQCDSFVAVGGGSAIDTAKGVNLIISENSDDLSQFAGAQIIKTPAKPLIVIPTTSGTGSEVTMVAVISDTDRNLKMAFTSHHLLPNVAILDPRMTLTLPASMTAATGMDALSHAMEAFISLQKNPISDAFCLSAIKLIGKTLPLAVKNGKDPDIRLTMANAATMAGIAFSNAMVGVVHGLGHAAGAVCHIPHGVAMSIFLPFGLEYNIAKEEKRIGRMLLSLAGESIYLNIPENKRAAGTVKAVRALQKTLYEHCGLPYTLKQAGATRDKLDQIAQKTMDDGALGFNPEAVELDDALMLLNRAYE